MSKKGIYHVHEDHDDKPLELGPPHITHWLRISMDAQYLYQMIVEYCRCHIYMPFTVLSGSSNPRSRIMVIERPPYLWLLVVQKVKIETPFYWGWSLFVCVCYPIVPPQYPTSSTAQGGGGSFKNRKPIGDVGCCESRMAERSH